MHTMKLTSFVPVCLLLLWLPDARAGDKIKVGITNGGITLICQGEGAQFQGNDGMNKTQDLLFEDESTGMYTCVSDASNSSIFVKFRTCDNCIELNIASITAIAVGDAVATIVLGWAVYLIASQAGPGTSYVKSGLSSGPERPHPPGGRREASNDPYQRLRFKNGAQKDTYDVINQNR